jgi:hypothetical protein
MTIGKVADFVLYGPNKKSFMPSMAQNSAWFAAGAVAGPTVIAVGKKILKKASGSTPAQAQLPHKQ